MDIQGQYTQHNQCVKGFREDKIYVSISDSGSLSSWSYQHPKYSPTFRLTDLVEMSGVVYGVSGNGAAAP
jgi:hypothetical protein